MPRKPRRHWITGRTPGFTPDYGALLQSDPSYTQFKGAQDVKRQADKLKRNQSIIQRLVAHGQMPDLAGVNLGDFGIDAATMAAIQANTAGGGSAVAGFNRQNAFNVDDLQQTLAARGMLRSGGLGTGLRLEGERDASTRATAIQQLLAMLRGDQDEFAGAEADRDTELLEYGEGLGERIRDANPVRAPGTARAVRVGPNLYRDAAGNYYDRHGNPRQRYGPRPPVQGGYGGPVYE